MRANIISSNSVDEHFPTSREGHAILTLVPEDSTKRSNSVISLANDPVAEEELNHQRSISLLVIWGGDKGGLKSDMKLFSMGKLVYEFEEEQGRF